jgi:hypothetical protein
MHVPAGDRLSAEVQELSRPAVFFFPHFAPIVKPSFGIETSKHGSILRFRRSCDVTCSQSFGAERSCGMVLFVVLA